MNVRKNKLLVLKNFFLALTGEVNLDTQSSDSSAEEMRESGRSIQSVGFLALGFVH